MTGIDLRIDPGDTVAIVGPNGSGKSTLLGLLATRFEPSGSLSLLGTSIGGQPDRDVRRRLGVAFDVPSHADELSGGANALFFARAGGLGAVAASRSTQELLSRFALGDYEQEAVSGYSFGMRRKLMLVEALAHEPDLLLLDEPTVGLDPAARALLWEVLEERASAGVAVVLATNELDGLADRVDRLVLLLDGRVVLNDTPEAVLATVEGSTVIDVQWLGRLDALPAAPPGVALHPTPEGLRAVSNLGSSPLPALLADLLDRGVQVTSVAIRTPGLADAFETLTGRPVGSPQGPHP